MGTLPTGSVYTAIYTTRHFAGLVRKPVALLFGTKGDYFTTEK